MKTARYFLLLLAVINIVRGGIHLFAPDGGIDSIAGLGRADDQVVLFLFAAIGASQLSWGAFQAYVVARVQRLVLAVLATQTLMTALSVGIMWFYRPPPVVIPGRAFNTLLLVALMAVLLWGWRAARQSRSHGVSPD